MQHPFKMEQLVHTFLKDIKELENPVEAVTLLLKDYIEQYPDDLVTVNLMISTLSSIALSKKKKELNRAVNSMQNLIAIDSIGTKTTIEPKERIVCFIDAMMSMFPNGKPQAASSIEREFYYNYVKDLKECSLDDLANWAKTKGYYEYLTNLLEVNQPTYSELSGIVKHICTIEGCIYCYYQRAEGESIPDCPIHHAKLVKISSKL